MGNAPSGIFGLKIPQIPFVPQTNTTLNSTPENINKTDKYNIPANSGIIDVDVQNLQKCMSNSGDSLQLANNCITNYVQGYDIKNNTFTPSKLSQIQNFSMMDNQKSAMEPLFFIVLVIIYLIIILR